MKLRRVQAAVSGCGLALCVLLAAPASAQPREADPYRAAASLRTASFDEVAARLEAWLEEGAAPQAAARIRERFAAARQSADPVDAVAQALAAGYSQAAEALAQAKAGASPEGAAAEWLTGQTGFAGDTLRLAVGRELARGGRYAAALRWLEGVDEESSIDPAAALFYRAACQQALLDREACLDTLARLDEVASLPRRYAVLARQMRAEMADLREESLDFVSRQMRDVENRLDRGEADPPLRKLQDDVLATLDKLIKDQEDQQNGGGGGGGSGSGGGSSPGGTTQPAQAAQESRIMGGRGPGRTAPKALGHGSGWGSLPPRQREEAWQQLGREFPSHYRDVVEQYFRELAREQEERGGDPRPTP